MPELPDVEFNRRNLARWMLHARVASVQTNDARIVRPEKPRAFVRAVTGRTVDRIERRGKWLKLTLGDGRYLFAHLGMTGWFEHVRSGKPLLRFERVSFEVDKRGARSRIAYLDSRRWGRMILAREDIATWRALGPDPLDEGVDVERLERVLTRRKRSSIKEALMDQTVLAGVGNVQATEALWKAGVDPRSKANTVSMSDLEAIASGLRWTIQRTLRLAKAGMGAEIPFCIYGRQGERCPRCGHTIDRVVLGGRTTTFCSGCQKRRAERRPMRARAR